MAIKQLAKGEHCETNDLEHKNMSPMFTKIIIEYESK